MGQLWRGNRVCHVRVIWLALVSVFFWLLCVVVRTLCATHRATRSALYHRVSTDLPPPLAHSHNRTFVVFVRCCSLSTTIYYYLLLSLYFLFPISHLPTLLLSPPTPSLALSGP